MKIREERPEEFAQIYHLVQEAFTTAQVSDGTEQDFVEELRRRGGYLPGLALVAEEDGALIGHIMLTKTKWVDAKGEEQNALLLAPLCVKEEYRNQGIGGKLIAESCRRASDAGYSAVFLIGNPDYYTRYGFACIEKYGISPMPASLPLRNCMARELMCGALQGKEGSKVAIE